MGPALHPRVYVRYDYNPVPGVSECLPTRQSPVWGWGRGLSTGRGETSGELGDGSLVDPEMIRSLCSKVGHRTRSSPDLLNSVTRDDTVTQLSPLGEGVSPESDERIFYPCY